MPYYVPKTILSSVTSIDPYAFWDDSGNPTDPWKGYPYQWTVSIIVLPQSHSDPTTPRPFNYNGLDINVGDWLAFSSNFIILQIVSIISQTDSQLTVILEDVDRYNLYNDPTQSGIAIGTVSPSGVFDTVIIGLGQDGMPNFANIPDFTVPINLVVDINNRFQYRNYSKDYIRIFQPGHGLAVGNPIYMTSDGIYHNSKATSNTVQNTIGVVTTIDQPGTNWFNYRPVARLVNNLPTLPGNPGDILYVDVTGVLTNIAPIPFTKPIYLKLTNTSALILAELPMSVSDSVDVSAALAQQGSVLMYDTVSNIWIASNTVDGGSY